ncbi:MAG: hypothetical protein ABIW34_13430 [Ginsengibacter sp.]
MNNPKFEIQYNGHKINIEPVSIGGQNLFRIFFENEPPFFITRTENYSKKFWTSVPEGKQQIAEQVGLLIEEHYKTQS